MWNDLGRKRDRPAQGIAFVGTGGLLSCLGSSPFASVLSLASGPAIAAGVVALWSADDLRGVEATPLTLAALTGIALLWVLHLAQSRRRRPIGPKTAAALLEREEFDLVLMDVHMPKLDGFETTRRIRQQLELTDLPIIGMTADATLAARRNCLACGMNDYVAKPFHPDRLLAKLAQWAQPKPPGA